MKNKAKIIIISIILFIFISPLVFIQSKPFAKILTKFAKKNILVDFGLDGEFTELSVKLLPPGVVIDQPKLKMKEDNPFALPTGTSIEAKNIEITFQLFQLLTGLVSVNGVVVNGADLHLDLPKEFFDNLEKRQKEKRKLKLFKNNNNGLTLDSLLQVNFKSVSLIDSKLDVSVDLKDINKNKIKLKTNARELTLGKGSSSDGKNIELGLDLSETEFEGFNTKLNLSQAHASIGLTENKIEVRNFAIQDISRALNFSGDIVGNIFSPKTLKSSIVYSLRGPLHEWINDAKNRKLIKLPNNFDVNGMVRLSGQIKADLLNFVETLENNISIELEDAKYEEWSIVKFLAEIEQKSKNISVKSLDFLFPNNGHMTFNNFAINLDDINTQILAVKTKINFENVILHELLGSIKNSVYPLKFKLNGLVDLDFQTSRKNQSNNALKIHALTDLVVNEFQFDNQKPKIQKPLKILLKIPEIKLKSDVIVSNEGVFINSGTALLPRSEMKLGGKVNSEGFDLDVNGHINLNDIGKLGAFDIAGVGDLHWTIKGKSPDILFGFDANMKETKYLDLNLGDVKGKVVWEDGPGFLKFHNLKSIQGLLESNANGMIDLDRTDKIDIKVDVNKGTIQDFSVLFSNFLKRSIPWYPYELTSQMVGTIAITGKTDMDSLSVLGDMELTNIDYNSEIFRNCKLRAGYVGGDFVAENVRILKKNGRINGSLKYSKENVLTYKLWSEGLSTADFDRLAYLDIPYRAGLNISSEGQGPIGTLKSNTHVMLDSGSVKNYTIPSTELNLSTQNARLKASANIFNGKSKVEFNYGWDTGALSNIVGEANNFDFLPILIAINPNILDVQNVNSKVSGNMNLDFKTGSVEKLTGTIDFKDYEINRPSTSLRLEKPFKLNIQNGNYSFKNIKFYGDDTDITLSGEVQNQQIKYDILGILNLKLAELVVPEIQTLNGQAKFTSTLTGHVSDPVFKLSATVVDAEAKLRSLIQSFEKISYKINWDKSSIKINDISAKYAGGKINGNGKVELYSNKVPDLDFLFNLDNNKIQTYPVVYARVNGRVSLSGTNLPYKTKGLINLQEALVKENFNSSEGSKSFKNTKYMPELNNQGSGRHLELFDLDIDIKADRGIIVKNDLFDGEVKGNLKLLSSIKSPGILGNITIMNGRLLFKDSYFLIQSGNLKFNNPTIIDPEFDMSAQTDLKGYKIYLVANGKTSDYQLSFQSQPQLSQNDIVNLLTLGVTSAGYENISRGNREAYTRDEMYGLIFNQSSINKGIKEKLGLNIRLDQSQSINPESIFRAQSGDSSATISPKVVIQKQVTKNLSASAGTTVGVGEGKQQNLDLEYNVSKNWSFLGVYEDQRGSQPQNSRTSMGADLKFKLRFK